MLYSKAIIRSRSIYNTMLSLAILTAAAFWLAWFTPAVAADTDKTVPQAETSRDSGTVPLEKRPAHVSTPVGERSEAYDFTETGPNRLRRMSRSESLPAEPQITKEITIGPQNGELR